jgi:pimeloyl-ACP methyl ester carboxylesterase
MIRWTLAVLLLLLVLAGIFLVKRDLPAVEVDAKYSNAASRFLSLPSGARIHYRDQGNPDGPPVVLIHGSNASLHAWEPWVAILGDDYRIVTLDLPGHGLTGRVPDDDYGTEAFVATVKAVVESTGLSRFVLGGNSMGGGVTWQYALRHPDDVQAMILVDASGPWSWREPQDGSATQRPLVFELMAKPWFRAVAGYLDPYYLTVQGLRSAYNNSPVVDDALIARYYELALREGSRTATMKRFAGFASRAAAAEPDLSVLDQPTLILWGARDALIPVAVGERFATVLPHATLAIYPDVGHVPMEEIPAQSAADVRQFLKSLAQPQPEVPIDETL